MVGQVLEEVVADVDDGREVFVFLQQFLQMVGCEFRSSGGGAVDDFY